MKKCACEICDHNFGDRCGCWNDCYGSVRYPDDCEDFDYCDDDDGEDEDDDDDEDYTSSCTCHNCGGDAYWDGEFWVCNECGRCFK